MDTHLHRYLCDRDRKTFDSLFRLVGQEKDISYNDFSRLSSKIMTRGVSGWPDVRASFERYAHVLPDKFPRITHQKTLVYDFARSPN